MATGRTTEVIQHLGRAVLQRDGAGLTDGQLLGRFLEQRDQAAFAALVKRHGTMVWGVCRRLLGHHDAEDAFQAAFLVLFRKAASVRPREMLASWLHGVARQAALHARRTAGRRRAKERQVGEMPEPAVTERDVWRDLRPLLDEELSRLPDKYRAAVVLCDLEGKTRKEAARQLGWPEGTVAGRLARARAVLAKRLARRGLAVTGAALAAVLTENAGAAGVPTSVVSGVIRAAGRLAAGEAAAAGAFSDKAAALSEGVLKSMLLTRLKIGTAAVLLVGLIALACAAAAGPRAAAPGGAKAARKGGPPPAGEARQRPRESDRPGKLLLARIGALEMLTPEGKENQAVALPKDTGLFIFCARYSPDGRRVAYVVVGDAGGPRPPPRVGEAVPHCPFKVVVREVGADRPAKVIDQPAQQLYLTWAPDGKGLLVTRDMGSPTKSALETVRLDPETGRTEPFDLPAGVRLLDLSPDGKTLLVVRRRDKQERLGLAAVANPREVRDLLPLHYRVPYRDGRFSPDGTKVLYTDADPADKLAVRWQMSSKPYLLDLATKKAQALADFPTNGQALGVAWSPDGKRVAYTWKQVHRELLKKKEALTASDRRVETEAFLMVADADGRNARTVASGRSDFAFNPIFGVIDWR
jgi:RNA polymerase sigma factor (sigma-70 family)